MAKTIKQSLEDLVIGLGGNPAELSDNTDTSDVIDDLNGAIKNCVESVIDDTTASETKTFSSSKIQNCVESIIDDSAASETKTFSSSKINSLIPADELPAVTGADDGKVLTVVSGAWGAAAASGGNEFFVITATATNDGITINKTYAEIESAFSTNKILYVNYIDEIGTNRQHIPLNSATLSGSSGHFIFKFDFIQVSDGTTLTACIQIDCDNEITQYFYNNVS